jgi:hypothetical protein
MISKAVRNLGWYFRTSSDSRARGTLPTRGRGMTCLRMGEHYVTQGGKVFCSHFRWTGRPGPRADIIVIIIIIIIIIRVVL